MKLPKTRQSSRVDSLPIMSLGTESIERRAFRHHLVGTSYDEAIRETLSGGGDTDTNACIVGGLIGAACGADAIPDEMASPVLSCDTFQGAHPRPHWLHTTQLPELTERLLVHQ